LATLTNADVIRFVALGMPDEVVNTLIKEAKVAKAAEFDLPPSGVLDLSNHRVSPVVIAVMHQPLAPADSEVTPAEKMVVNTRSGQAPSIKMDCSPSFAVQLRAWASELCSKNVDPFDLAEALDMSVGMNPDTSILNRIAAIPSRINAPDIIKVTVDRNGKDIAPMASTLKPTEYANAMGAKWTSSI
jgi:hypothetical protein